MDARPGNCSCRLACALSPLRPPTHCPDCHQGSALGAVVSICSFTPKRWVSVPGSWHWEYSSVHPSWTHLIYSTSSWLFPTARSCRNIPSLAQARPPRGRSGTSSSAPDRASLGVISLDYGTDTPRMAADTKCQVTLHTCLMMTWGQGVWCRASDDRDRELQARHARMCTTHCLCEHSEHGSPK